MMMGVANGADYNTTAVVSHDHFQAIWAAMLRLSDQVNRGVYRLSRTVAMLTILESTD